MRAAALLLLALGAAAAEPPRLRPERVTLVTSAGELEAALYADAAPRHVARFLALARAGAYDGAPLARIKPGRLVLFGGTGAAAGPALAPEPGAAHHWGVLSAVADPRVPDPSGTGFAVLTAAIPALDGAFTAFGELVSGGEALDRLAATPAGADGAPLAPVVILRATVSETAWARLRSRPPAGLAAAVLGLVLFAWGRARRSKGLAAAGLAAALAGYFAALAALGPVAPGSPALGAALFAGAVGTFRLMAYFESAPPVKGSAARS